MLLVAIVLAAAFHLGCVHLNGVVLVLDVCSDLDCGIHDVICHIFNYSLLRRGICYSARLARGLAGHPFGLTLQRSIEIQRILGSKPQADLLTLIFGEV